MPLGVSAGFLRAFLEDVQQAHAEEYATLTTKDVCDKVVIPRTKDAQCAYVDVIKQQHDEQHLGNANVFVSHAWRYKFVDVIGTMLEFADEQGRQDTDAYFWFDLFINNQNIAADLPQDWWSTTFKESIADIGHVLLVLTPWSDPVPLTRAWCLWEIFCSLSQEGVTLTIQLPIAEREALKAALRADSEAVTDTLVRVQAERAEAWNPKDKEMIFKAIRDSVGFGHLNERVKEQMRSWCLQTADAFVHAVEQANGNPNTAPQPNAQPSTETATQQGNSGTAPRPATQTNATSEVIALYYQVGALMTNFGKPERAIELLTRALAMEKVHMGERHSSVGDVHTQLGIALASNGSYDEAIAHFNAAIVIHTAVYGADSPRLAVTYGHLGGALLNKGEYDESIRVHERAVAIEESAGTSEERRGTAYSNLATAYAEVGDYRRAIAFHEKSMRISEEARGPQHPGTANDYNNLGGIYQRLADYERAAEYYSKALNVYREVMGEHPSTAIAYDNLGMVHKNQGNFETAIECHRHALEMHEAVIGKEHPTTGMMQLNLGTTLLYKGDTDQAVEHLMQALGIFKAALGHHASTAAAYGNLGMAFRQQGDYIAAIKSHELALDIEEDVLGQQHPTTGIEYFNAGLAFDAIGHMRAAVDYQKQALAILVACLGEDNPKVQLVAESLQATQHRRHILQRCSYIAILA
ncbi:hypothetical protein PTSG_02686 [Salpingoeca rosetta]|uniref:Uncharacterized protein n=1 Tax=Salpingoeca rosetta (strain ATCC 50818 / BSB-021) TaxID=946362 RepID=F2U305_SALR5|nr:uncharacterized protein PTSG_02686 [Salpingoeca rosetta]EGD81999.1 hypothetical protein PTSG_02686 [Salpingoeca rosetta]|eukprot:XP_004996182.1 hypothetical protein PTSG_02686 [Salpingoeca rosetta]